MATSPVKATPEIPADAEASLSESDWLASYTDAPEVVQLFCESRGVPLESIKAAIDLVPETFPAPRKVWLSLSEDPDGEDEKLVVGLTLAAGIEEAVAGYDRFVTRWISAFPWETRKHVCLSYTID